MENKEAFNEERDGEESSPTSQDDTIEGQTEASNVPNGQETQETNVYNGKINPEEMQMIIDAFEPEIKRSDAKNPQEVVAHLLRMHKAYDENPHAMVISMMNYHKIKPEEILPHVQGEHNQVTPEEQVEMEKALQQFTASGDKEHITKVAPMMEAIFNSPELQDHGSTLDDAYENATWAHPELRKMKLEAMMGSSKVDKAKKAASSLKPDGPAEVVDVEPKNFSEAFKKELARRKKLV